MDGNLYLDEEQVATTKEKTVLQELEEGTTKLNNFKSNLRDDSDGNNININSGGGGGIRTGSGTGVKIVNPTGRMKNRRTRTFFPEVTSLI